MRSSVVLFAHGAGASSHSEWMQRWKSQLETLAAVETFDYPYMAAKKKRPDSLDELIRSHRAALAAARARHPGGKVVLAGKSMGSRIGCHVALEESVDGLVCFGYPLVAPGGVKVRDQVLLALRTPILFVQGTRDALCPLDKLAAVRGAMKCESALHVVASGDHSLKITVAHTKSTGITQTDSDRAIFTVIDQFFAAVGVLPDR